MSVATIIIPPYPPDNTPFELTATERIEGLAMVKTDGYGNWDKWKFNGEVLKPCTKRFRLVSVGDQSNFESVKREFAKHGTITQGQWRAVFREKYSKPDGKGPIGVADASWVDPRGHVRFPCVYAGGEAHFYWIGNDFHDNWRWLVEVQ